MQNFIILMTGRNVGRYIEAGLASLAAQTYAGWHAVYLDDVSDDASVDAARAAATKLGIEGKLQIVTSAERRGKAHAIYEYLQTRPQAGDDICCILDADDQLADSAALEKYAAIYQRGYDIVWSDYMRSNGELCANAPVSNLRPARQQAFNSRHFFSFRRDLFVDITPADLSGADGAWLQAACDVGIALAVLERSSRRYHLPQPLYRYTFDNENSHHGSSIAANAQHPVSGLQAQNKVALYARPALMPDYDTAFFAQHLQDTLDYELRYQRYELERRMAVLAERQQFAAKIMVEDLRATEAIARLLGTDPLQMPDLQKADIAPAQAYYLMQSIMMRQPALTVTLMAGFSALVIAGALRRYAPQGKLVVFDVEAKRLAALESQLKSLGLDGFVELKQQLPEAAASLLPLAAAPDMAFIYAEANIVADESKRALVTQMQASGLVMLTTPDAAAQHWDGWRVDAVPGLRPFAVLSR